jgi:6-pyruvoyltetrahydropterin/6-carboxytetrahydropterin synthase
MYRISKRFEFSAAHALAGLPPEHQCSRVHGHNYIVELVLESPVLDETSFVRDYGDLKGFKHHVDKLDHQWLGYDRLYSQSGNEAKLSTVMMPALDFNPTAENMARHLYHIAVSLYPEVTMVGVSETPKTWAWFAPQNLTLDVLEGAASHLPEPHRTNFLTHLRDNA